MMEMRYRDYKLAGGPIVVVPVADRAAVKEFLLKGAQMSVSIYEGDQHVAYADYSRRTDHMKWTPA